MRPAIAALGYRVPDSTITETGGWSFRDSLRAGYADVCLMQTDRFEAALAYGKYFQALRHDCFDGVLRARRHQMGVKHMSHEVPIPTAWVVVSCYYAAYFAAVELLRAAGIWISFFSGDEVQSLTAQSTGTGGATLSPGSYLGRASWDQKDNTIKVTFCRQARGSHEIVWSEIVQKLLQRTSPRTSEELSSVERFKQLLGAGKNAWSSPSETRNRWNYQIANLYSMQGDQTGEAMRKLISGSQAAYGWAKRKKIPQSQSAEASALAYVMNILSEVLDQTRTIIFHPATLARLRTQCR